VVFLGYAWWKYNRYSKSLDAQARYDEDTPLARIALESQEGKKAASGDLGCTTL